MSIPTKILLINSFDGENRGLRLLREREADLIDISEFEPGFSDSTMTGNPGFFIHNDLVYKFITNYVDYDKKERIYIAKLAMTEFDRLEDNEYGLNLSYFKIQNPISTETMVQGGSVGFEVKMLNANNEIINNDDIVLVWYMFGNTDKDTAIAQNGGLVIGENETGTLNIRVCVEQYPSVASRYVFTPGPKPVTPAP